MKLPQRPFCLPWLAPIFIHRLARNNRSHKGGKTKVEPSPWWFNGWRGRRIEAQWSPQSGHRGGTRWQKHRPDWGSRNSPFTQGLRHLCLPYATTKLVAVEGRKEAERLPRSFKCGTEDVQTSPWTPWSSWSFEHVQNSRTKVAEEVGRSHATQRRQDEGTYIAVVAEWMYTGRPLVAPSKMRNVVNIVYQFGRHFCLPCILLCLSWPTNSVHWAITVATTVPPFVDHGSPDPPWQWFCLHSASFARPVVPLKQLWSYKEGTRTVLQQLHRNRTLWVGWPLGVLTIFSGRSRVARRSQPCVKGLKLQQNAFIMWRPLADHCTSILQPRQYDCISSASFEPHLCPTNPPIRRSLCDCFELIQNFMATMASKHLVCYFCMTWQPFGRLWESSGDLDSFMVAKGA